MSVTDTHRTIRRTRRVEGVVTSDGRRAVYCTKCQEPLRQSDLTSLFDGSSYCSDGSAYSQHWG